MLAVGSSGGLDDPRPALFRFSFTGGSSVNKGDREAGQGVGTRRHMHDDIAATLFAFRVVAQESDIKTRWSCAVFQNGKLNTVELCTFTAPI